MEIGRGLHAPPALVFPPPGLGLWDAADLEADAPASGERTPDFLTLRAPPAGAYLPPEIADGEATPRGCVELAHLMADTLRDKLRALELCESPPRTLRRPPLSRPAPFHRFSGLEPMLEQPDEDVPPPPPPPAPSAQRRVPKFVVSMGSVGHPSQCAEMCDREVCEMGALCPKCHICRADKAEVESRRQQEIAALSECPSVGSMGHPKACGEACKFVHKARGCKDGSFCTRCHLCRWSRYRSHHNSYAAARPRSGELIG